jgi:hypothetical protein
MLSECGFAVQDVLNQQTQQSLTHWTILVRYVDLHCRRHAASDAEIKSFKIEVSAVKETRQLLGCVNKAIETVWDTVIKMDM